MDAFDFNNFFAEVDTTALEAGRYEAPDGDQPIPNGARLPVIVEHAEYLDGDNVTLSLMWRVTGGDYANRVIFQKLLLAGEDRWNAAKSADKRRKARTQLAIMVKLTGASKIEEALRSGRLPSVDVISSGLLGKALQITVGTWKMEGDDGVTRTGNWVKAVGPKEAELPLNGGGKSTPRGSNPSHLGGGAKLQDDEIPW